MSVKRGLGVVTSNQPNARMRHTCTSAFFRGWTWIRVLLFVWGALRGAWCSSVTKNVNWVQQPIRWFQTNSPCPSLGSTTLASEGEGAQGLKSGATVVLVKADIYPPFERQGLLTYKYLSCAAQHSHCTGQSPDTIFFCCLHHSWHTCESHQNVHSSRL